MGFKPNEEVAAAIAIVEVDTALRVVARLCSDTKWGYSGLLQSHRNTFRALHPNHPNGKKLTGEIHRYAGGRTEEGGGI